MTADGRREASPAPVPAARGDAGVLIETKLYAPAPRPQWVERVGLVRYLADATGKLILVGAPAGFGKSILVAQWRCGPAEGRRFGWVSLDPGDDDPGRLWWHLVCGCSGPAPGSTPSRSCGRFTSRSRTSRSRCCRCSPTRWPR
jgi:LuxR family maltose regulon positive regulatory protein